MKMELGKEEERCKAGKRGRRERREKRKEVLFKKFKVTLP